jgi:hypothetical protein
VRRHQARAELKPKGRRSTPITDEVLGLVTMLDVRRPIRSCWPATRELAYAPDSNRFRNEGRRRGSAPLT